MSGFLGSRLHLLFTKSNTVLDSRAQLGHFHFHSFTVSYLKNSYGLSLETAKSLSTKVEFETPEKPDSVLNLLKSHGFNKTHISKIVKIRPQLLLANAQKSILPKLEFFHSVAVSSAEIVRIISSNPYLLICSLERNIIPSYKFFKTILLVDEKVVQTFRSTQWGGNRSSRMNPVPNIALLREFGVSQCSISVLIANHPSVVFRKHSFFTEIVKEVKQMGLNPLKPAFVQAIAVFSQATKATLESRFEIYGRWGWSRDEILSAFKRCPRCMLVSNNKITRVMDFLVNKMGWPSKIIAKNPGVLFFSFEKRIFPRCSVAHVLLLKGLMEKDLSITSLLVPNEKYFLNKYVTKYQESVPQLLDLYKGKVDLLDLGINPVGNM